MAVPQRCVDESYSVYAANVQESPFSYGACWPGEWLWVDSNGTDGKPTFHRLANLSWFSKICNHFREIAAWSRKSLTMITVFGKKDPLRANFQKLIPKVFTTLQNHVLCANFVKYGWPEIVEVVHCLPDKKTSASSPALASARIVPKICQGQLQTIYLGVRQISSKCVHFQRSYSRTCEHCWNTPKYFQYSAKLLRRIKIDQILPKIFSESLGPLSKLWLS